MRVHGAEQQPDDDAATRSEFDWMSADTGVALLDRRKRDCKKKD